MILSRRSMLGFLAAPAIVRAASLMPVKMLAVDEPSGVFDLATLMRAKALLEANEVPDPYRFGIDFAWERFLIAGRRGRLVGIENIFNEPVDAAQQITAI